MEIPPGFDPNNTNYGFLHETFGSLAFAPVGDLLMGNPVGYDFSLVVKGENGHRLVPLASAITSKLNADFCGEQNGSPNGVVVGNRIRCEECTPRFCLFKAIIGNRMAAILDAQKKMKKLEVTTQ